MHCSPTAYRVLYVEDNPADAQLLDFILKNRDEPVELTMLENGEAALEFINSKPFRPDVIALDLNLPRIDGLTVLAALKSDPSLKSIPVLVFVAPNTLQAKRAFELKADLCLAKPFDLEEYRQLGDVIRELGRPRSESVAAG